MKIDMRWIALFDQRNICHKLGYQLQWNILRFRTDSKLYPCMVVSGPLPTISRSQQRFFSVLKSLVTVAPHNAESLQIDRQETYLFFETWMPEQSQTSKFWRDRLSVNHYTIDPTHKIK